MTRSYSRAHNNLVSEQGVMGDFEQLTRVHDLEHKLVENSKEVCEIKNDVRELRRLMELYFSSKERNPKGAATTTGRRPDMAESSDEQQVIALAQVSNTQNVPIKQESGVVEDSIHESSKKNKSNYSKVVIAGERACMPHVAAANVAKECLLAAVKSDPRAAHIWVNLANAYYVAGDHRSAGKCLEKAAKLEPNCMSTRYVVPLHRIKDAERSQDPTEQLSWAVNEMASILREGDSATIELRIAWAGLAMVHKAQHEIAATFGTGHNDLTEVEERALYTLKQAIKEDPDDAVQWHQLGLHNLCTLQFKTSQKYLKAAVGRGKECSYAWPNLDISLQLSEDEPSSLEPDLGGQNHPTYPGFL
uniref:Uncharacterized protein n=1 Tax=Nelumbo nucifera TaxID=4432 RepID=A0A822ZRS5_NELNU|nr:TPA_asm: hypothetical protein HUJ06_004279 [Nelumbo nucifera]